MENFDTRLKEFKILNSKRNMSKGHMQGLDLKEYNRINSLHSFLMSSEKGRNEFKKIIKNK